MAIYAKISCHGGGIKWHKFTSSIIKISSIKSAHLCLDDKRVSKMHAVVEVTASGVSIIDLGSTAGTIVNGQRTTKSCLIDGDIVLLGNTMIEFTYGLEADEKFECWVRSTGQYPATAHPAATLEELRQPSNLEEMTHKILSTLTSREQQVLRERFGEEKEETVDNKIPADVSDVIDSIAEVMAIGVAAVDRYQGKLPIPAAAEAVRKLLYGELQPIFAVIRDAIFAVEEMNLLKQVEWLKMLQMDHHLSEETALRLLELNASAVSKFLSANNTGPKTSKKK
jgi:hypothetical protein